MQGLCVVMLVAQVPVLALHGNAMTPRGCSGAMVSFLLFLALSVYMNEKVYSRGTQICLPPPSCIS